jgi:hypothetical protein
MAAKDGSMTLNYGCNLPLVSFLHRLHFALQSLKRTKNDKTESEIPIQAEFYY